MMSQLKRLYYPPQPVLKALQQLESLFREAEAVSRKETFSPLGTHSAAMAKAQPKDQPLMEPVLQQPILLSSMSAKHSLVPAIGGWTR